MKTAPLFKFLDYNFVRNRNIQEKEKKVVLYEVVKTCLT